MLARCGRLVLQKRLNSSSALKNLWNGPAGIRIPNFYHFEFNAI